MEDLDWIEELSELDSDSGDSRSEQLSRRKLRLKDERNCSSTLTSDYAREVP
jgi:hypothetical protein